MSILTVAEVKAAIAANTTIGEIVTALVIELARREGSGDATAFIAPVVDYLFGTFAAESPDGFGNLLATMPPSYT